LHDFIDFDESVVGGATEDADGFMPAPSHRRSAKGGGAAKGGGGNSSSSSSAEGKHSE
jgi:hypothetical protein